MKKLIIAALLGISFAIVGTSNNILAVTNDSASTEIRTIVVSLDNKGDSEKQRVYQLTDNKMHKTNRTMAIHDEQTITHWYAQRVKINGENWWKVGENQYFKPLNVNVVNLENMKQHGIEVKNYANYTGSYGVSMVDEDNRG
ncbi:hypothetical protein [Companilactobacillus kimchiensis]|nr:hypothetical protein [Companilactobacillus kimchiensis]